jgi:hypothetical protein
MEYTEIWQPLLLIFTIFFIGLILGAALVYFYMVKDYDLLMIDLEFAEEKIQQQAELLDSFYNKYEDDDYEAY